MKKYLHENRLGKDDFPNLTLCNKKEKKENHKKKEKVAGVGSSMDLF